MLLFTATDTTGKRKQLYCEHVAVPERSITSHGEATGEAKLLPIANSVVADSVDRLESVADAFLALPRPRGKRVLRQVLHADRA
jgi:hypothetical protein